MKGKEFGVLIHNFSRVVFDKEDTTFGFYTKAEYFDCEMDIATRTGSGPRTKALMAFAPYNKNPQTPATIISMGMRQIFAFLALYPRVEKCGIMAVWSQSKTNPTTGGEVSTDYFTVKLFKIIFFPKMYFFKYIFI